MYINVDSIIETNVDSFNNIQELKKIISGSIEVGRLIDIINIEINGREQGDDIREDLIWVLTLLQDILNGTL